MRDKKAQGPGHKAQGRIFASMKVHIGFPLHLRPYALSLPLMDPHTPFTRQRTVSNFLNGHN